jgi:hypothetical protein
VSKKVRVDQRITLFHLINDVVQHAKRKGVQELLDKCQGVLKEAMLHFRDGKVVDKVLREEKEGSRQNRDSNRSLNGTSVP